MITHPILFTSIEALVPFARTRAMRGVYDGRATPRNLQYVQVVCKHDIRLGAELQASIIFTRDIGHHTSGWWKNPDFERCWHLSTSFWSRPEAISLPNDKLQSERLARAFFADDARLLWCEAPYSAMGKARDVWHYRLFCNPGWQAIKPRGEVYSTAFTGLGWQSFSELHGYRPLADDAPFLMQASDSGDA